MILINIDLQWVCVKRSCPDMPLLLSVSKYGVKLTKIISKFRSIQDPVGG